VVTDKSPHEAKSLLELKAKKPTKPTDTGRDLGTSGIGSSAAVGAGMGGAAAAAAVLNAIDEDGDDGEDAPVPRAFEYDTDAGEDEE
jgi:26S proteasome regulatory subunit N2